MDSAVKHSFVDTLTQCNLAPILRAELAEVQINLGYLCNQACAHCHVEAGPKRSEVMTCHTMQKIFDWVRDNGIQRADLTGGAPELNPDFRRFVDQLLTLGVVVTSRCNLTVMDEPGQQDLAQWYAERNIRLVCSLPCYTSENVDHQRGQGAFGKSINGLQKLNQQGYGSQPEKMLDLVYNPLGPTLPPNQAVLQQDYNQRLYCDFGIKFNQLLTLTNLPIKRFAHFLKRTGQGESYLQLLVDNFNPDTVKPLMCRHLLSVDWRGNIYDCDFNQMLDIPCAATGKLKLWQTNAAQLTAQPIAFDSHCFGCTAGAGSSCGGALA